jgi:hypothetical protein
MRFRLKFPKHATKSRVTEFGSKLMKVYKKGLDSAVS